MKAEIMKKRVLLVLSIMLLALLNGCGAGKTEKNAESINMGRYIETEIAMPEDEDAISIVEDENQDFVLFTQKYTNEKLSLKKYKLNDGKWKEEKESWLQKIIDSFIPDKGYDGEVKKVIYGEDGNYYALVNAYDEDETRYYIFCSKDGTKDYKQVEIDYLNDVNNRDNGYTMYQSVTDIRVLSNGTLCLFDLYEWAYNVFSPEGEKLGKMDIMGSLDQVGISNSAYANQNMLIGLKSNNSEIGFIDGDSLQETKSIAVDQVDSNNFSVYQMEDNTLIMADANGIHRLEDGGTLWETVVDGSLNTMSMPNDSIEGLFARSNDGVNDGEVYYILYQDIQQGVCSFVRYTFNPDIVSVPEEELTIYSLEDNSTVRQAIAIYQRKNHNVKVNYVVAMAAHEDASKEDSIKALNSELVSGNGADILVLDGLPADSYINKGILMDISDICAKSDTLDNIKDAYTEDGKIYRIPTKIKIPVILGNKDVLTSGGSLNDMISYAKSNQDHPFVGGIGIKQIAHDFLKMEASSFIAENNSLDTKAFKQFLLNLNYLKENSCADESGGTYAYFASNLYELNTGDTLAAWDTIMNMTSLFTEQELSKKADCDFESVENGFFAYGSIGINASSQKIDLASDFLTCILSDGVQKTDVNDGLPVCKTSWDNIIEKEVKDMYFCMMFTLPDGTQGSLDGEYPKKKIREQLANIACSVTKPIEEENGVTDLLSEDMDNYISGDMSIDETIQKAESTCNRYLSEQQGNY